MRRALIVLAAGFGIALALVLGLRLEQASLAVVVGIVCGIGAGLPVSAVLLYLFWRERQERQRQEERRWRRSDMAAPAAPPVVILNAGRGAERLSHPRMLPLGETRDRDFVIVGEEDIQQQDRWQPSS